MAKLFISQERLDTWNGDQKVNLEGQCLTLAADGRSFNIRPAVRFLRVSGAEADPNNLVNCVKTEADLEAMGADLYMEAVIIGDTAYDVQPGFLGDPLPRSRGK